VPVKFQRQIQSLICDYEITVFAFWEDRFGAGQMMDRRIIQKPQTRISDKHNGISLISMTSSSGTNSGLPNGSKFNLKTNQSSNGPYQPTNHQMGRTNQPINQSMDREHFGATTYKVAARIGDGWLFSNSTDARRK
jgi:hypothetical protein